MKKITIISSDNRNKILNISKECLNGYKFCHYLIPNGSIKQLLDNIEYKLQNYTYNDFCILLIGDADFRITKDYSQLIDYIRKQLLLVQHTNVILCSPTFKCNNYSNLFNLRIEAFNDRLYLDNLKHEYGFILDSNRNLTYSNDMFNNSGLINNLGTKTIFRDILKLIHSIEQYNQTLSNISLTYNNYYDDDITIIHDENKLFRM
ncbi:unnamed protein product [Chilo suppressalis]|uniref:Uncharacterized protein n=1 Tax=Chilo suppressalis TaxID=168631 RepID=A0ABN8B3T8_CHISP|nr:unnamed protein product [Chilo suppressalis]